LGLSAKPIADSPWCCYDCATSRFPKRKPAAHPPAGYSQRDRRLKLKRANCNDALGRTVLMCAIEISVLFAEPWTSKSCSSAHALQCQRSRSKHTHLNQLLWPVGYHEERSVKFSINRKDKVSFTTHQRHIIRAS
jgi:hypothetical protein